MRILPLIESASSPLLPLARKLASLLREARVSVVSEDQALNLLRDTYGKDLLDPHVFAQTLDFKSGAILVKFPWAQFLVTKFRRTGLNDEPLYGSPIPVGEPSVPLPVSDWEKIFPGDVDVSFTVTLPDGNVRVRAYNDLAHLARGFKRLEQYLRRATASAGLTSLLDRIPASFYPRVEPVEVNGKLIDALSLYYESKNGYGHVYFTPSGDELVPVLVRYKPELKPDRHRTTLSDEEYYPLKLQSKPIPIEEAPQHTQNIFKGIDSARRGLVKTWLKVFDGYWGEWTSGWLCFTALDFSQSFSGAVRVCPLTPYSVNLKSGKDTLSRLERELKLYSNVRVWKTILRLTLLYDKPVTYYPEKPKKFTTTLKDVSVELARTTLEAIKKALK